MAKTSATTRSIRPRGNNPIDGVAEQRRIALAIQPEAAEDINPCAAFDIRQTCGDFIVLSAEKFHSSADLAGSKTAFGVSVPRTFGGTAIVIGRSDLGT